MKRLHRSLLVTAAVLSLLAGAVTPADGAHEGWWNYVPAFFAFLGFLGCLAIIFFAKTAGKLFLRKKEDYYDVH